MADIFISYGRADDEAFVRQLRADLEAGGLTVWWDRAAMESRGRTFLQEIRDAIAAAGRLLLVIGPQAVESGYVRAEWEFALQACKVVVPVLRLGDFSLVPAELARLHCPDFRPGRPAADGLAELTRILSAPVPALARLSGVDPLPASHLPRPEEADKLAAAVLADVSQPVVITSAGRTVALEGMGGVGKSVLAAAFARACPTRRAFGDGIVWLRVGQHPDLTGLLRLLGDALGDAALDRYTDETSSQARLSRLLEDRDCLVVLDDVWDVRYATAVVSALGPRCRLLVTTRDSRIGLALGAAELRLGVLTDAQALTLLASWSGQEPAALPAEARAVVRECGNLPLALAMIGALVRGRADRWAGALDRLRHADLDRIALQFPGYAYPDLLKAIQVSVDALPGAAQPRYLELAVFADDAGVPEAALEVLWGTAGLDRADTQDLADLLVDRSLAQRGDDGRLTLHDLQFDYVRRQVPDLAALHGRLLDAYARRCPDGWASGPDDGYFFSQLVPHLVAAGRPDEARALLRDYGWLAAKLRVTDVNAVLADYQKVPNDPGERLFERALRASAHVVARDPGQLGTQLYGRLLGAEAALRPAIERAHPDGWLRPLSATLTPSGGPLLRIITEPAGHVEVLAITADGRLAVSGALHGMAKVWDLETGLQRHDLKRADNAITALAISPDDGRVIVGTYGVRVFDLATGTEPFSLAASEELVPAVRFSRDGQRAISCTGYATYPERPAYCTSTVWDMATGAEVTTFGGYAYRSRTVAAAADGPLVLAESGQHEVEVWDPRERTRRHVLPGHTSYVRAAAMTEDGRLAVTGADSRWPMDPGYDSTPEQDCALRVWDTGQGRELFSLPGHTGTVNAVAVTPDGGLAVSASDDRTVRVWDLTQGRATCTLTGHSDQVQAVAVTPDGRRVVSAASDNTIRVWDPRIPAVAVEGHADRVTAVAAVPGGHRAVSVAADGTVRVWDARTGAGLAGWPAHEYGAFVVAGLPDGRHALSGGSSELKLWDLGTGTLVHAFGRSDGQPMGRPTGLAVSADGRWAACVTEYGEGAVYDLRRLAVRHTFPARGRELVLADVVTVTPGGLVLATAGHHGLGLWSAKRGINLGHLTGEPDLNGPGSFAVTPDGRHAAATAGGYAVSWDVEQRTRRQVLANRTDFVTAIAISPDGGLVLVAEDDSAITVHAAVAGTVRSVLTGHADHITHLLVTADGRRAVSVAGDGRGILSDSVADRSLRAWDLERGTQAGSFTADALITSVALVPDGRTVIAGDAGGRVHLLRLAE